MSTKTKRRLSRVANALEAIVFTSIRAFAGAVELVLIDGVFGKSKYRKRGAKMRPIIHRTINRTVYVQRVMLPTEQERVHVVGGKR
jgi:hypothetical protein